MPLLQCWAAGFCSLFKRWLPALISAHLQVLCQSQNSLSANLPQRRLKSRSSRVEETAARRAEQKKMVPFLQITKRSMRDNNTSKIPLRRLSENTVGVVLICSIDFFFKKKCHKISKCIDVALNVGFLRRRCLLEICQWKIGVQFEELKGHRNESVLAEIDFYSIMGISSWQQLVLLPEIFHKQQTVFN